MFFVADRQEHKEKKIRGYLRKEPMIAAILAAVNFEWTVGRCILFVSKSPNVEIRDRLANCYGLDKYKEIWKEELTKRDPSIPPLAQVVQNWQDFKEAFNLRHKLIHGRGTCSRNMATEPVEIMLAAVNDLYKFADSRGIDLHAKLPVRRRKRAIN
jgi:hypothetical protein